MATDLTKSGPQILVDLINESNALALTLGDITFGVPSGASGNRNTRIRVSAIPASGYTGSRDVTYNRVNLAEIPGIRSTAFSLGEANSAFGLIDAINAAYGLNITHADVYDDALPVFDLHDLSITKPFILRAKPDSLVYRGTLVLTIIGNYIPLNLLLLNTSLSGFTYPVS